MSVIEGKFNGLLPNSSLIIFEPVWLTAKPNHKPFASIRLYPNPFDKPGMFIVLVFS